MTMDFHSLTQFLFHFNSYVTVKVFHSEKSNGLQATKQFQAKMEGLSADYPKATLIVAHLVKKDEK